MIPRIFDGQTVFIVAGGPSLVGFDFWRLSGRHAIAINRAFEVLPGATVLWWSDADFWRQHQVALLAHAAPWKATGHIQYDEGVPPAPVLKYRFTGLSGFDHDARCLRHGNNSGYAAIHLAAHLGAKRIVLLGFDMRYGAAGESHWHGGHSAGGRPLLHMEATLTDLMMPYFESLARPLADLGVDVINASPHSRLTTWPRCTIEEALREVSEDLVRA